ncbi:MAG: hypothetical protein PWQ79_435 [Thermococcaceae archaeon]|nr:hypothetical protein [Thermococcaceae archaeon]
MKKDQLIFIIATLLVMGSSFWYAYRIASSPELNDYIGDEVWYVPASRNILNELGLHTHYTNEEGMVGISIIFANESLETRYVSFADYEAIANGGKAFRYNEIPGSYYEIPRENEKSFLSSISKRIPSDSYRVVTGYRYPDKENIHNYLNLEHPFLGKDFIMAGMLIEDKPLYWRLPGLIAFLAVQALVLLTTWRITKSYLASLIALVFTAADPTLQATAVAAMLDIYVALGTALFMALLVHDRIEASGIALGLAASAKLSGAFAWPVLLCKSLKGERSLPRLLLAVSVLPAIGFFVPNIPAVAAVGMERWLREFLGSFKWHLSYKGPNPNTSPFWEWFINYRPFPFHFNPNIFAETDPFLLISTVVFLFALPWLYRRRKKILEVYGIFWSTVGFFALQYVLGGKTQFSFYATVLVPPAAVVMGVALKELLKWEAFSESLRLYWGWMKEAKNWILWRLGKA